MDCHIEDKLTTIASDLMIIVINFSFSFEFGRIDDPTAMVNGFHMHCGSTYSTSYYGMVEDGSWFVDSDFYLQQGRVYVTKIFYLGMIKYFITFNRWFRIFNFMYMGFLVPCTFSIYLSFSD